MLEISMNSPDVELNPNPIVRFLETPPAGFTKEGWPSYHDYLMSVADLT
jgi:hypothetical protein